MDDEQKNKSLRDIAKYGSIAGQMLVIILLGTFAGYMLDKRLAMTFPLFKLVLILFSVFLALYIVLKDLLKNNNKKKP